MKKRSPNLLALVPMVTVAMSLWAAPVTCDQARTAVNNWLKADSGLGCRLGQSIASVRTCVTTNGANFHVAKLVGGGFVVTSADTRQEPVVAFSASGDLVESADNPLWGILQADFSRRANCMPAAVPRAVTAETSVEAKWNKLLSATPMPRGNGIAAVSDLRVDEILQSKWGQAESSAYMDENGESYGYYCYNMCTPNSYPCGCVATAMGQIMRYYRYPDSARIVARKCLVDGVSYNYRTSGKSYDWEKMPLIPEDYPYAPWYAGGTSSDEECEAIGWLTYDCGVSVHMSWGPDASESKGAFAFEALTNVFNYANARGYAISGTDGISMAALRQIMLPNLDAGCPVMLGIAEHEVVADGYGYSDGTLYTHVNMGWDGFGNAWYNLPNIATVHGEDKNGNPVYYTSTLVSHITYNIFANETGELLSGRIVDADGRPIKGVLVSVSLASTSSTSGGNVLARTYTNDRGIYFFRLQGGKTYRVTASYGSASQSTGAISLAQSVNPSSVDFLSGSYVAGKMAYGNSWGNDLVFNGLNSVAMPEFSPPSGFFHPSLSVTVSCQTEGATIRYTLDGSDPDATSPEFWASSPIVVTADTTIKARAFKDGLNPSAVATATYTYDISQDRPLGDFYANPIRISGMQGKYSVPNNSAYTLEADEPWHTLKNHHSSSQAHSIWYSWTAPASGKVTFTTRAETATSLYSTLVAVYVGETLSTATRMAFSADYASSSDYSTSVSLDVEQGTTYHIVGAVMNEAHVAAFTLSWVQVAVPAPPVSRTLYVNAAMPANSTQDGLSATTAFRDLPMAVRALQDGDVVLVAPGTYSPAVVGASDVTFKATGDVSATVIDGGGRTACCSVVQGDDSASAAFEGFTLANGGGIYVADFGDGVAWRCGGGAVHVTLSRCIISNCVAEIGGGAYGCDLRNCLIVGNDATRYAGGAAESVLVGCTVSGNSAAEYCGGIDYLCVATNSIVWGNAVDDGSSPDFEDSADGVSSMAYCCSSSSAKGKGNLAADPKFREALSGDFRLRPGSPCLDAGAVADISSTESDLAGNVRIQSSAPDIGAYEGGYPLSAVRLASDVQSWYDAAEQVGSAEVECDNGWRVSCDAKWIVFHTLSKSGDATLKFTILANEADVSRTAEVAIVDNANNRVAFQIRQAAAAVPPVAPNRYFGLLVGLNEYDTLALRRQGYDVTSLWGSVPDAISVCARFTDRGFCRREDAIVLTNQLATVAAIRAALANIAAQAVAGDTVLYYHSGHGYLATGETVALVGYAGFYWDYDLAADLGRFADGVRVVVVADTCHSAGLFKGVGARPNIVFKIAERVQSLMSANRIRGSMRGTVADTSVTARNLAAPSQIGWIAAADYDQYSWDKPDDTGGAFTAMLLEGWSSGAADRDGDGRVSFYDLWQYARHAGSEYAASYGVETEAQCLNEDILMSVLAGVTDVAPEESAVPGYGTVMAPKSWTTGKKATWKAVAAKGSVFARWEGAVVDSLALSKNELRNPSLEFIVPEGFNPNGIRAVFISLDSDRLYELGLSRTEFELKETVSDVWVEDDSKSYVTASVSGLPAGLKFNAKKLQITGAPTKSGIYWVQVKAKNASGYQWAENIKVLVSGGGTEAKVPKLTRTMHHPLTVISTNVAAGTVTGTGVYAEGKKVTVSAKPAKDWVFVGWYCDAELTEPMVFASGDWRRASQSVIVPEVRYVFAKFVTTDEDKRRISLSVAGEALSGAQTSAPMWTSYCGVALNWPIEVEALSQTTVKAAGLPSGVKLVQDKKTKAYSLAGVPTAASKAGVAGARVPSKVKLTVTTAGKSSRVFEVDWVILPLPAWAQGTFDGVVQGDGTVTLTVDAKGKISGKMIGADGTWTLSAVAYERVEGLDLGNLVGLDNLDNLVFRAMVIGKSGKLVITNEVEVAAEEVAAAVAGQPPYRRGVVNALAARSTSGTGGSPVQVEWTAWQNLWKTEPWKTDAKPFAKAQPLTLYVLDVETAGRIVLNAPPSDGSAFGVLTLKFDASGAVKATAKFVTGKDAKGKDVEYSAKCSSVLVPRTGTDDGTRPTSILYPLSSTLYFPPKAGKFGGYGATISLVWDGVAFRLVE